jgi:uncharacterized protein Usg
VSFIIRISPIFQARIILSSNKEVKLNGFADIIKKTAKIAVFKIKRTLKAVRALKSVPSQNRAANKLDGYIDDFLNGKIERFCAAPKKPELAGKKIFWQYWHQEIDANTSKIVISCLNSVKKHSNGYEVIILTGKTVKDYVDLPDFVWQKLGKGRFNNTKLSNLVRLYLLSAYGGVWLDATIYLTKPIAEGLLQKDFFAFQRSETPPPDADTYKKFDPLYFSWDPAYQIRMLNSFIIAKPHNKIIDDLLSIHLEYWRREKRVGHYFFFQILFNRMTRQNEWKSLNCEIVGDTDCHALQVAGINKFDYSLCKQITAKCDIHKLTYRFERFGQTPSGSFFDIIANETIN